MYKFYLYHPDLKQPVKITTPEGWDALGKSLTRDRKYHGVFSNYTTKLKFIKDGKTILHNLDDKYGVEANVTLIILKRDSSTRKYIKDYVGRLNFTSRTIGKLYFECNVENTGLLQKFLNRQEVKVDINSAVSQNGVAINSIAPPTITLPSQVLRRFTEKKHKAATDTFTDGDTQTFTGTPELYVLFAWEDLASDEVLGRQDYSTQIVDSNPVTDLKYYFKTKEKGSYTFNIRVVCEVDTNAHNPFSMDWWFAYGKNGVYTTTQVGATITSADPFFFPLQGDFEHTFSNLALDVDTEVYLYGKMRHVGTAGIDVDYHFQPYLPLIGSLYPAPRDITFTVQADTVTPDTTTTVIPPFEFLRQVVDSICDQKDTLVSNHYGRPAVGYDDYGAGSKRGLTNGYQIRGFSYSNKHISCSFKDAFASFKSLDNIGTGYEQDATTGKESIRLEPMDFFYQPVEVLKLNYVFFDPKKQVKSVDIESFFNIMELGDQKSDFSKLSHLDEFNTKRQFTLPITQLSKTLSYLSNFISSGYTWELVRRDREASVTKDNQADNDIFIVQLRGTDGAFTVDRNEDFDTVLNVISPTTIYNLKLSPGRRLRNHGNEIRQVCEKMKDQLVKYSYTDGGNSSLVTKLTSESFIVTENANVVISDLPRPRILSDLYDFEAKLTRQQLLDLFANPYGYISFSESDRNHSKMYLLDAKRDPQSNKVNFKGIAANV